MAKIQIEDDGSYVQIKQVGIVCSKPRYDVKFVLLLFLFDY